MVDLARLAWTWRDQLGLGATGLDVSEICLGCMSYGIPSSGNQPWSLDEQAAAPFFQRAIEAGINFFDTANVYGRGAAETAWGEILSARPRHSYILATKVWGQMSDDPADRGLSAGQIAKQIDASLARLLRATASLGPIATA